MSLVPTSVKTADYTASPNDFVLVDTSLKSVNVTLPTGPPDQTQVGVKVINVGVINVGGLNRVTVACPSATPQPYLNVSGGPTSLPLSARNQGVVLQYQASTSIWYVLSESAPPIVAGSGTQVQSLRDIVSVRDFGAAVDGQLRYDASTSGMTLTCTGYQFQTTDVGKIVIIAGNAQSSPAYQAFITMITSVPMLGGPATLAAMPPVVSNATIYFGTDDHQAWQNALDYLVNVAIFGTLIVPAGISICGTQISEAPTTGHDRFIGIRGAATGASVIVSTNSSGWLSIDNTGLPSGGRNCQLTFEDLMIVTPLAGGGTAIQTKALCGGVEEQTGLAVNRVEARGMTASCGYWTNAFIFSGMWRPLLNSVIVSNLFGPGISGNYDDSSPLFLATCGIILDESYSPYLTDCSVWSCLRAYQLVSACNPGPEGMLWVNSGADDVREGFYFYTPGVEPGIEISGGGMNCRDYAFCLNRKKFGKFNEEIVIYSQYQTISSPMVVSNGGAPVSATAMAIPVASVPSTLQFPATILAAATGEKILVSGATGTTLTVTQRHVGNTAAGLGIPDTSQLFGPDAMYLQAAIAPSYEVDTVSVSGGPTGGFFQLRFTWNGRIYTSANIQVNQSNNAAVQAAILAAASSGPPLPAGGVQVTGVDIASGLTIAFRGLMTGAVTAQTFINNMTGGTNPSGTFTSTTAGTAPPMTVTVSSTNGAPRIGAFQVYPSGEWFTYTSIDQTHFYGVTRAEYGSSDPGTTYAIGTILCIGTADVLVMNGQQIAVDGLRFVWNGNTRRVNIAMWNATDTTCQGNVHGALGYAYAVGYEATGTVIRGPHIVNNGTNTATPILDGAADTKYTAESWRGVRLYTTGAISVASTGTAGSVAPNASVALGWNAVWPLTQDTEGFWAGGNSAFLTIPANRGIKAVRIRAKVQWSLNGTGLRLLTMTVNNATGFAGAPQAFTPAMSEASVHQTVEAGPLPVNPGDSIKILVGQSSGQTLNVVANAVGTALPTWVVLEVAEGA